MHNTPNIKRAFLIPEGSMCHHDLHLTPLLFPNKFSNAVTFSVLYWQLLCCDKCLNF
jgi:hypothetical protein